MRVLFINKNKLPNNRITSIPKTPRRTLINKPSIKIIRKQSKRKQSDIDVKLFLNDLKKEGLYYYHNVLNKLYIEGIKILNNPYLYPVDYDKYFKRYPDPNNLEKNINTIKMNFINYNQIYVYVNNQRVYSIPKRTIINHKEFLNIYKHKIQQRIGTCHIDSATSKIKDSRSKLKATVDYLPNLIVQLRFVAETYGQEKKRKRLPHRMNKFRKDFMTKYATKLYGRPCLENILDAGINMFVERNFVWKGRNLQIPLDKSKRSDVTRYINEIIIPAIQSFQEVHKENKTYKELDLEGRKKRFWEYIKKRPVHMIGRTGIPGYGRTMDFDINATYLRTEAKNYMNLLEINVE